MDEEVEKIDNLEILESLLGDIERAMAEEGSSDEHQRAKLEQMREECIKRKRALERIKN
jgi:hypothetical protein